MAKTTTKRTAPKSKKKTTAQRSTKKSAKKAELRYIPWSSIELEDLNPLLQRHFVVGQKSCWRAFC